jgi:lipopolysaccharide export system permease protein
MKPTAELLQSSDPRDRAELQWRISTPVMALILMLIAVPLARLRPRQGRFGRIGIAILVYFIYWQLMAAARTWVEAGSVPEWLGLWWVHGVALALGLWLLSREAPLSKVRTVPA